ncbi:MAG: NAD-dependent deacylase [Bacteroidetes bacterium]|nr:NAD-dependent deacylase [Bacteroidota bacterium]MBT4398486.1 NAD-dependent deacylase [Bacteroidota bacterium]MBT4409219.1 NAD-dependent deacylase [Bacteroidota bacterium]MBT7464466.1 NAD-dependent deacylase [Bacteroidota bacterium]
MEKNKKRLVVLSGAGMSAESGIRTFREMGGLWEEYDVMEVASPEAWERDPELVLRFYNERRKALLNCQPNPGHLALAEMEHDFDVHIVTQNVDDLHERAGSSKIMHLHGELKKVRSSRDESLVHELDGWELKMGDLCEKGSQLRPHIVWFGEAVPMIPRAVRIVEKADILLIIGTSLQVYPAASLIHYVKGGTPVYVIDPNEVLESGPYRTIIKKGASEGMKEMKGLLKSFITT